MKTKISLILTCIFFLSCNNLDLNPLTQASADNWYTSETGIVSGINHLFSGKYWCSSILDDQYSEFWPDSYTDDWTNRNLLSDVTAGTINSQTGVVTANWNLRYECIANANIVLKHIETLSGEINEESLNKYKALARFSRAYQYSLLIFFYGDVPYYETELNIEEALTLSRMNKEEILQNIYNDFDFAASYLPTKYSSSEIKYPTKGAVLGFKARTALRMNDWTVVRDATQACINLGEYQLLPDFNDVLTMKNSSETIFSCPRSAELDVTINTIKANQPRTRTSGGTDFISPSWDLFCSFVCTDGLPIDESPLYNPQKPFENRDPRCASTITEFGTRHLGVIYQPHPDSTTVYSFTNATYVKNNDSKVNTQWAAFNGLVWKKGISEEYWLDKTLVDPDDILLRYADILLMYAEAKIELGEIDKSVLDAVNQVRSRAYGVNYTQTDQYPSVITTNQDELRKIVRLERRMELAFESLRYFDIIRWRIADKVLNKPIYGLLDIAELRSKIVNTGLWFFPAIPSIDEDGVADFTMMYNDGLVKLLAKRIFDPKKQYLWPIPATEIQINPNLVQNPGY